MSPKINHAIAAINQIAPWTANVYQITLFTRQQSPQRAKTKYIGITEHAFITRYNNHQQS